jgi:uncharacterized membrane protein
MSSSSQKRLLILFVLILIGFGIRILFLSGPSLWLDEAASANIAKSSIAEYFQWARGDFHPPLYYLLLHLWSFLGHDEFTLRLFSVITNCFSGIILYSWVRKIFDPSTALLTLLLFTLSPFQIRYSQEVRMYSLLGLWIGFVLFFTCQYLKNRRWPFLVGYTLSSTLGLYTHYHAGVFLAVLNTAAVIQLYRTEKIRLWSWILAQFVPLALFAPWLPNLIHQVRGGGLAWFPFRPSFPLLVSPLFAFLWGDPFLSKLYQPLKPLFLRSAGVSSIVPWIDRLGMAIVLTLIVFIVWKKKNELMRLSWSIHFTVFLLVGTMGLSFILSFKSNIYGAARYLFGASSIFYVVVAILLAALSRFNRKTATGFTLFVVFIQVFMLITYYQPDNYRENWRGAVAYIRDHSKPHHAVGFHFDRPMAPYVYYAADSIPAFGFLEGGQLSSSLSMVLNSQYEVIWLFDYLAELYDPKGRVIRELAGHGYIPTWHHSFNGVPLTMWRKTFPPNEKNRGSWGQSDPQDPG